MKRALLNVLVFSLGAASACAQLTPKELAASRRAATNSIEQFREFLTPQNCRLHGFNSTNDAAIAYPGDPMQIAKFDVRELEKYHETNLTKGLVQTVRELLYPILVKGAVVSSARLRLKGQRWEAFEWGRPIAITNLSAWRSDLVATASAAGRSPDHIFAIQTPVGGWWMAGFSNSKGELTLRTSAPILPSGGTNHNVSRKELEQLGKLAAAQKSASD